MLGRRHRSELEYYRKNAGGEYVYDGGFCRYAGAPTRKKQLAVLWLLCGISVLSLAVAGCLPAPGMMGSVYVLIPYAAALIALCAGLWAVGRLSLGGDPLREPAFSAAESAPRRLTAAGILTVLTLAGEGIFLILHGAGENPGAAAACLILLAVSGCCVLLGRSRFQLLRWEKIL